MLVSKTFKYTATLIILSLTYSCKTRQFESQSKSISEETKRVFLERTEWPTAADYISIFGKIPEIADKFENRNHRADFSQVTELIVGLEKAFPDGQYYCVGRDVRLACEALDLFYRNYTQEERIGFIPASGNTFTEYFANMPSLLEMHKRVLLSYGFKPETFIKNPEKAKPFVIIDATTWSARSNNDLNMSQARMFLKAAFDIVRQNGGKTDKIVKKIGSLAIHPVSAFKDILEYNLNAEYKVSEFFEHVQQELNSTYDHPNETLRMKLESLSYGELFWHEKYNSIQELENGKVRVVPGIEMSQYRPQLFNRTIDLNQYILSEEFRRNLRKSAKKWNLPHILKLIERNQPQTPP